MENLGLVGDLAVVASAAVVGGAAARLLKLPAVLGYLAAGIAIGPHTPGPAGDIDDVQTIADLGVAFLMFTLGIQFSLRDVRELRGFALVGGALGTAVMAGLGAAGALTLSLRAEEAIVVGMALSVSSSMVALRLLEDRGLLGAPAGRLAIAVSLVQDMAVVVMLTVIPVLGGEGNLALDLAFAIAKAIALIAAIWIVGTLVLPRVLGRIAVSRSRELFLLTVVALALGTASLSDAAGLSLAFGAFLAGLLLSESEYAHRTLAEVLPLREVFAVVFFVVIGMLLDPDTFSRDLDLILLITGLGVFGKIVLVGGAAVLHRYPLRTSLTAGVALGTVGEFSFVIGTQAFDEDIISVSLNETIVAGVLLSMALAPLLFMAQEPALAIARGVPGLGALIRPRTSAYLPVEPRRVNHAIILGYTPPGRAVASALAGRDFRFIVIDEDPQVFRELSERGIPCILGNPAMPAILEMASIDRARVLVVTLQDPGQIESVAATARQLNRRLDIVARGITEESPGRLMDLGVALVVDAEFEVGQEFVRHTLQRFGVSSQEVQTLLSSRRRRWGK